VDTHLLESVGPGRYRFHDLLRVYAAERAAADLPPTERDEATGRLLDWYMHTADAAALTVSPHRYNLPLDAALAGRALAFTDVEDAFGWYDDERANVVSATRQAYACGMNMVAWRLPAPLFTVFSRRGNWADLVTTHRVALESVRRVGDPLGEAWVLNNLGQALGRQGLKEGIDLLEKALTIRRDRGDQVGEAQAAHNLAEVQYLVNGPEAALPYLRQSLEVQRAVGHSALHGATLNNLGEIYLELGRLNESVDCLTEALPIFTGIGSAHGQGHVLTNLGRVYLGLDRQRDALDCLRRALAIHQASGDRPNQALALRFLAQAQLASGDAGNARKSLTGALAIFTELDDSARIAEVQSELASLPGETG